MATRRRGVKNVLRSRRRRRHVKSSIRKKTYRNKSNKVTRKFEHLYHVGGLPKKPTDSTTRQATTLTTPRQVTELLRVRRPSTNPSSRVFQTSLGKGRRGKYIEELTMECMVKSFDKDGRLLASLLALPKNARVDMPASLYSRGGIPTNVSIKAKEIKVSKEYFENNDVTSTSKTINSGSPINLLTTYLEDYPFEMIFVQYVMTERVGPNGKSVNHMTPSKGIRIDLKKILGIIFQHKDWINHIIGAQSILDLIQSISISKDDSPNKEITRHAISEINNLIKRRLNPAYGINFSIDPKISSSDSSSPRIQCSMNFDFTNQHVVSCIMNETIELSSAESMEGAIQLGWTSDETREKPLMQQYAADQLSKQSKRPSKSKKDSSIANIVRKQKHIFIEVSGKSASRVRGSSFNSRSGSRVPPASAGPASAAGPAPSAAAAVHVAVDEPIELDIELGNIVTIESLNNYDDATPQDLCKLNFTLYESLARLARGLTGTLQSATYSAAQKVSSCFSGFPSFSRFPSFSGLTSRLFTPSPAPAAAAAVDTFATRLSAIPEHPAYYVTSSVNPFSNGY